MIVVTTDHGRTDNGYGHGGQSERERTTWVSTNIEVNDYFNSKHLAIIDIAPSIYRYMGFSIPEAVKCEQDGISFVGKTDIFNLVSKTDLDNNSVTLSWDFFTKDIPVEIYVSTTNNFKEGRNDEWIKIASTRSDKKVYTIDLNALPSSSIYKFVLKSPNTHLNRWVIK